mgnify:CR=1 FL=1
MAKAKKLPTGIKPQLNKMLNAYLKLDEQVKDLNSNKNEIKNQIQAVLDEFDVEKISLTNGSLSMTKAHERYKVHDFKVLIPELEDAGLKVSTLVGKTLVKPSLRINRS